MRYRYLYRRYKYFNTFGLYDYQLNKCFKRLNMASLLVDKNVEQGNRLSVNISGLLYSYIKNYKGLT